MKEVTIFLSGGLGNNLFQIAYGEYLDSKGYSVSYNSYLTKKNWITKKLGWSIHRNEIAEHIIKNMNVVEELSITDTVFLVCKFIQKKIINSKCYYAPDYSGRRYFGYAAIGNHLKGEVFSTISEKIRVIFRNKIIPGRNETVLHIRRGDFSKECSLGDSYYIDAIKKIKSTTPIIVVTDDPSIIDYVRDNIHENVILSKGESMLDDFFTIFNAKKVIMSNSTYCYWACVLGNVEFVTYPERISNKQEWLFCLNNIPSESIKCDFISEMEDNG
ncbi:alpha-1,2-fucosyltransferase [Vibrio vulnificus]|nr:alpha-1,2-fucosyltransferase [Vibrio vulnificus]